MTLDPSKGWNQNLQRVCEREVDQVWGVGFEASDLRLFIEGLATRARKSRDGRGLEDSALKSVFRSVFGRDADEPANLLTVRLPGLGAVPGRPGAREFIDADFADAASCGDFRRYIESPFASGTALDNVVLPVGELGRQIAISTVSGIDGKVSVALTQASGPASMAVTSADLISLLTDLQVGYKGPECFIDDANFNLIVVDPEIDLSAIYFRRCIIDKIEFGRASVEREAKNSVRFQDCVIDILEGAVSQADMPSGILLGTTSVEEFASFNATNEAVMKSSLKEPVKVLLTILRKLFMQRGTGRQYSALKRGLPSELRRYVDPIVGIVKSESFAQDIFIDRKTILIPNRNLSGAALSIINSPNTSGEPLIQRVRNL